MSKDCPAAPAAPAAPYALAALVATLLVGGCVDSGDGGVSAGNGTDEIPTGMTEGASGEPGTPVVPDETPAEREARLAAEAAARAEADAASAAAWFADGAERARRVPAAATTRGAARNVILFVGDGMSLTTVTAARILEGQIRGESGEENALSFDAMPFSGLSKTYNVDAQVPDSAGTMTALVTGVKTDAGVVGVDEDIVRGDCGSVAGNELVTALELAELGGLATGIVTTARLTHATPASTYAKSADRNWEDVSDMPADALEAGCVDIASQLLGLEARLESSYPGVDVDGIEVAMGGGRRHFLPNVATANSADIDEMVEIEGDRTDGRNLIEEWEALYPAGRYVFDQAGFDAIDTDSVARVLGLFDESHMEYEAARGSDVAGEPSLAEMTGKAIGVLDNDADGFFLMVESGRIDHAHHAGGAYNALTDTIELAEAVARAQALTDASETLIIVTADHGHVFTMAGYPRRGNPILGTVVAVGEAEPTLASDGTPYTTLGYTNGRGFRNFGDAVFNADASYLDPPVGGRADLTGIDTTSPGFHQEVLVPLTAETHSGDDVGVYAEGPGASLVTGTNEQSLIFHVMNHAGDLSGRADRALAAP